MKQLLVPCDFSAEAEEAFIFSISAARAVGATITVLHVLDIPPNLTGTLKGMPDGRKKMVATLKQAATAKFTSFRERHGMGIENITLVMDEGAVARAIRKYSKVLKPDAIIMGTKGATGLREFLIGSNTEKIVRFSDVPVFAIKKAVDFNQIRKIVYPTSLTFDQSDFMSRLKKLQQILNAQLHLLYVNTPHCFMDDEDFREFIQFYELTNVTFSFRQAPVEKAGILNYVREETPDLLAMATHGRKGLSYLFSGSVSEHVVNRVACPIWTYALKKTGPAGDGKEKQIAEARRRRHVASA